MKRNFLVIILLCAVFLTGCSAIDRKAFCLSTAGSGVALGVINPFALPCIANSIVDMASSH